MKCTVCERESVARGLCAKHYKRWRRHGDPEFKSRPADWGTKSHKIHRSHTARAKIYATLFGWQSGLCAICGASVGGYRANGKPIGLHVDHCHETGKIRGLLCGVCNTALGGFRDNPDMLRKAVEYLEHYGREGNGFLVEDEPQKVKRCSVPGCDRIHSGEDLCRYHLRHVRAGREIKPHVCKQCNKPMPEGKQITAECCSVACKMRYHRAKGCYANPAADAPRCKTEGCDKLAHAQGLCRSHYMRAWRYGDPEHDNTKPITECTVDGCTELGVWKGMCKRHYHREYQRKNATKIYAQRKRAK